MTRLVIGVKEITNPALYAFILKASGLAIVIVFVVLPIILTGLVTTLTVIGSFIFLCGLLHFILVFAARNGLVRTTRGKDGAVFSVTVNRRIAFSKRS
jgi:hypothetical protein